MSDVTLKMLLMGEDKSASKAIKGVGKSAEETEGKLHSFGKIATGVFTGMVAHEAFEKVTEFFKGSIEAAAEDQAAQRRLALALKNTTGANKEQVDSVSEWIDKQSEALGLSKDDIMPAFERLAETSHSVKKAQQEMSLAFNASAGTGKSLSTVTQALAKANLGNTGSLGRLGIKTKDYAKNTIGVQKAQIAAKTAQVAYNAALAKYGKTAPQTRIAAMKLATAHEAVGKAQKTITSSSLSLNQVLSNMGKTFKGQAEVRAHSFQGELDRLHTTMHELEVKVGQKLLPILVGLGEWFLDKGLPAAERLAQSIAESLEPAFNKVRSAVMKIEPVLMRVGDFMQKNPATVKAFAITLGIFAAAAAIATAATAAWDAVLDANPVVLLAVAIAGLVAAFVYAYTHSEKFRAIVQGSLHAVEVVGRAVGTFFAHTLPTFFQQAWNKISGATRAFAGFFTKTIPGAVQSVIGFIKGHWPLLVGIMLGPIALAAAEVVQHWRLIVGGAKAMVGAVGDAVGHLAGAISGAAGRVGGAIAGIVSRITHGMSVLPGDMIDIGINVVSGIVRGIESGLGRVAAAAAAIVAKIPGPVRKLLGIASPSKVMRKIGQQTMDGLVLGLKDGTYHLTQVMSKVHDLVSSWKDKLSGAVSARNSFASGFSQFSSSVFGADYGTDANGNPNKPTVASILAYQQKQKKSAKSLNHNVAKLLRMGLSKSLLEQLQAAGPSGIAEINALAGGASKSQIRSLNQANAATYAYDRKAGMLAGNAIYGGQIATDSQKLHDAKLLAREIGREIPKHLPKGEYVTVKIDGQTIITAIRKTQRTKGKKPTV